MDVQCPNPGEETKSETQQQIKDIIDAASKHDIQALNRLIETCSFAECKAVDVQDSSSGHSPLHAAIASCEGVTDPKTIDASAETLSFLLENGAIWNLLDRNELTAGCLAKRFNQDRMYQIMVNAGVRAEMLLNRLDEYDPLEDQDGDEEDRGEEDTEQAARYDASPDRLNSVVSGNLTDLAANSDTIQSASDSSVGRPPLEIDTRNNDVTSGAFLSSSLSSSDSRLLDEQQNGVMMAWESGIMSKSADALLTVPGLRALNIGFGMGIIDSLVQGHTNRPVEHHIVEAHPDVLEAMRKKGWFNKEGVVVHAGKWQDVVSTMASEGLAFDAIYYDTFAESYNDFKQFFSESIMGLLEPSGRWSFFNGMGADRQISYDVYQKIIEIDLYETGYDVEWTEVELPDLGQAWEGVRRKYWNVDSYRLPVCTFMD